MPTIARNSRTRWRLLALLLLGGCLVAFSLKWGDARGEIVLAAPLLQATDTPTDTPSVPTGVVISEFRTRGINGDNDEFVEIFNATAGFVNIGGWQVRKSSGCGFVISTLFTIPANTLLFPGQHYLAVSDNASVGLWSDLVFTTGIPDNGGLALTLPNGSVVDQVGMCSTTYYREGTALTPLSGDANQSYERNLGGVDGSCDDSGENAADFALRSPSDPQNITSPLTMCAGVSTFTPTSTSTSTATGTATYTATATATASSTPTTTSTPSAPIHLVISEFRVRGPKGSGDEFVEIFNPTGAAVNIGLWKIMRSGDCSSVTYTLMTISSNTILQPGQHFLAAAYGSSITNANQTFTSGIADGGGVALANSYGTIIDQVGLCNSTYYQEGITLPKMVDNLDQSYERRPGGLYACHDTDDNSLDFALITPSNPQNKSTPLAICSGVLTSTPTKTATPTRTPTHTPTRTPTRWPTLPAGLGFVVINEFLPHPISDWNGDGLANFGDEYIEIVNAGDETVNLRNWKLDDGGEDSSPFILPDIELDPGEFAYFYGSETGISLSDGGETVRLKRSNGTTADIFNYPVVKTADQSWCRLPDEIGTWGFDCVPTPGEPNARVGAVIPSLVSEPGEVVFACLLRDTVPDEIIQVECFSPGTEIWNSHYWDVLGWVEIWIAGGDKWPVIVR